MNLLIIGAGENMQCYYQRTENMKIFDKICFIDDYERYELSDVGVSEIDDLDQLTNDYALVYSNSVIRHRTHIEEKCLIEGQCVVFSEVSIKPHSYIFIDRIVNNDKEYAFKGGVPHV